MFYQINYMQAAPMTMHCNTLAVADETILSLLGGDGSTQNNRDKNVLCTPITPQQRQNGLVCYSERAVPVDVDL